MKLFILCRKVMSIIFAFHVNNDILAYLDLEITAFLKCFVTDFPDARFTAKMHFLIHYPCMIAMFGPLWLHWCMRYEGKHQYFKRLIRTVRNFINVPKTLTKRHQMLQCFELNSNFIVQDIQMTHNGSFIHSSGLPPTIQDSICSSSRNKYWSVSSVTVRENVYHVGSVIVLSVNEENIPLLFKLEYILLVDEEHADLCGKIVQCVSFLDKYFSYKVCVVD